MESLEPLLHATVVMPDLRDVRVARAFFRGRPSATPSSPTTSPPQNWCLVVVPRGVASHRGCMAVLLKVVPGEMVRGWYRRVEIKVTLQGRGASITRSDVFVIRQGAAAVFPDFMEAPARVAVLGNGPNNPWLSGQQGTQYTFDVMLRVLEQFGCDVYMRGHHSVSVTGYCAMRGFDEYAALQYAFFLLHPFREAVLSARERNEQQRTLHRLFLLLLFSQEPVRDRQLLDLALEQGKSSEPPESGLVSLVESFASAGTLPPVTVISLAWTHCMGAPSLHAALRSWMDSPQGSHVASPVLRITCAQGKASVRGLIFLLFFFLLFFFFFFSLIAIASAAVECGSAATRLALLRTGGVSAPRAGTSSGRLGYSSLVSPCTHAHDLTAPLQARWKDTSAPALTVAGFCSMRAV
jgi:hypothetical protein